MTDVDVLDNETIEEIEDTFCRVKENMRLDLIRVHDSVRVCECAHKYRIQMVRDKMSWFKRMSHLHQLILLLITFAVALASYGFWLGRYFNHSQIFGGCSSWMWPFRDCPVAF